MNTKFKSGMITSGMLVIIIGSFFSCSVVDEGINVRPTISNLSIPSTVSINDSELVTFMVSDSIGEVTLFQYKKEDIQFTSIESTEFVVVVPDSVDENFWIYVNVRDDHGNKVVHSV